VSGLGIAIGPVVGGALLDRFWWGSVFLVNVPIVLGALAVGWWVIPESRNPQMPRFDPVGVVLSVLGASGLVWATIQAPARGWGSGMTLGSFAVALATLGCFVAWELHCQDPMLELGFFRNPRFSVANVAGAIANFTFAGTLFVLTQLLQTMFGYSALAAGLHIVPMAAVFMAAGLVSPRLAEHVGTKRAVALGLVIFATGLIVLALIGQHAGYGPVLPATLAVGIGFGMTLAPTTDAVMGAVPREQAGLASGSLSTMRQVGQALGVAVIGSLLVSGYHSVLTSRTRGLGLSGRDIAATRTSLGTALGTAHHLGGATGRALDDAARAAFTHGMHLGMVADAGLLVLGAILALRYLPARAREALDPHEPTEYLPFDVLVD
jgi:MFS family permease